ncbi:hypothetical protein HanRHA438_Chr03g0133791 [Helianthus annuus]|nr:hypothetical protein HanIR_Chr03g0133241 [Helianthus annuus]KAJ0936675.1 hypothetical protein HanRHA438_Chr03g0133791 [Helianthus annuus]
MRVRWSAIGGGFPETFSWFLAFSLFLRKRSGSSRGSFMSLLELELIHYVGWRLVPSPAIKTEKNAGQKVHHGPVLSEHGPWLELQ